MRESTKEHWIPTQRYKLSAGLAALITLFLLSLAGLLPKDLLFMMCFTEPLLIGFLSAFIFGARGAHGLRRAVLAGSLGHGVFYVLLVVMGLLGLAQAATAFLVLLYFTVLVFPLGLLISPVGAILGWLLARATGR